MRRTRLNKRSKVSNKGMGQIIFSLNDVDHDPHFFFFYHSIKTKTMMVILSKFKFISILLVNLNPPKLKSSV